jgi:hypothetical protein
LTFLILVISCKICITFLVNVKNVWGIDFYIKEKYMKRLVLCASLLLGTTLISINSANAIDLKASALSAVKKH